MSAAPAGPARRRPVRPCPICGKPSAEAYWPFCSKRCADIDLGRWLGGRYAIPGAGEAESGSRTPDSGADGEPDDR